jgi:hypothetical protein
MVIRGLLAWRHLLVGFPHKIHVLMDHSNLKYYCHPQKISHRITCYLLKMAKFDFELVYKPGASNKVDHLSCCPDYDDGSLDNQDVTVLPPHLFIHVTIPGKRAGRPDRPGRTAQTKTQNAARAATRQRQYEESTFSARLAEALRQHRMAVRTDCTSSSVMRDITDQLAQLVSKEGKSSSNEDVPAWHGPCGPERPPRR